MGGWPSWLAVLAAVGLAACGSASGEPQGTGLRVASVWSDVQVDQLEFLVMTSDGTEVHAAERRPQVAQGPLASGVDVVILLPAQMAGQRVRCVVNAYSAGAPVRRGEVQVDVVGATVVDVQVSLGGSHGPDAGTPDAGVDARVTPDLGAPDSPRDNGQRCAASGECASGSCVDGVCCDTVCAGQCRSCIVPGRIGTCSLVPAGTRDSRCQMQPASSCGLDGTCGANGGCRQYPAGTSCGPGTCSGNMVSGGSSCNGTGLCVMGGPASCGAYLCDPATRSCKTSCTSNGDCWAPSTCSSKGVCGTFKALGQACMAGGECASGNCVDGVCCSSQSCGTCFACNVSGVAGSCRPVPAGTLEPHGLCQVQSVTSCGQDGTCNGSGACGFYPNGTMCRLGRYCLNGGCR